MSSELGAGRLQPAESVKPIGPVLLGTPQCLPLKIQMTQLKKLGEQGYLSPPTPLTLMTSDSPMFFLLLDLCWAALWPSGTWYQPLLAHSQVPPIPAQALPPAPLFSEQGQDSVWSAWLASVQTGSHGKFSSPNVRWRGVSIYSSLDWANQMVGVDSEKRE